MTYVHLCSLGHKTLVIHFCNGALVLLIGIGTPEPMLLFTMGASITSAPLYAPLLFLRFGRTSGP